MKEKEFNEEDEEDEKCRCNEGISNGEEWDCICPIHYS